MLKDVVIHFLIRRFGDAVSTDREKKEFAIFQPRHPEVGEVRIEEDGNELILCIGDITHGHFGSYEEGLSEQEHFEIIAESVVEFLAGLFSDEYYLFSSERSGGWTRFDMVKTSDMTSPNVRWYKWSGPIPTSP